MADVALVKSIYTSGIVTALGELTAADNAKIPGTLQVAGQSTLGSLAGFLFGTAGVVSALSGANRFFVGNNTHDVSITGTQAITGVGFQPSMVILFGTTGAKGGYSLGFCDPALNQYCLFNNAQVSSDFTMNQSTSKIVWMQVGGAGTDAEANITSMDSGGFTLTWAKTGNPTGTCYFGYLCLR